MVRTLFTKLAAGGVMSLALFAWTSQADAFHHHRGWGGSYGGYGSSGGSSGGSWGGGGSSGGGWGSSGGSSGGSWGGGGGHWHKHWRWGGSSGGGSSGGYYGGSSGGSSGGWGSSGGSSGGSAGGTYYYSPGMQMSPVDPSMAPPAGGVPAAPAPGVAPAPGTSTSNMRADGLLSVNVPDDAKIYVNGQATTSLGEHRQYVSRDLAAGFNYSYEVRAEVVRDGRTVEQVKKIDVRAGETANLAFDFKGDSAETSLTLHVPSDAKVYLAGNATKANGETRVFRTTGLNGGKSWDGYTVRVELERGGRTVTKEETITLKAGQSQELRFDFDGDKIASR